MSRTGIFAALALIAWAATAFWNSVKPLPPGTRVSSLAARFTESQVDVIDDSAGRREILARQLAAIDRAEQLIVLDECPLAREIAQHVLTRKHQRPNLKVVVVSDPLDEAYGGTPAQYLVALEQAGIVVARIGLDRLRDSNPLYAGLWRLSVARSSEPRDQRQLMVADDGAGGWLSMVPGNANGDVGVELRGGLAHAVLSSELQIADWSTGDDRLPSAPSAEGRAVGSIDVRFLTEGAIRSALLDAVAAAGSGDELSLAVQALSDRQLIGAALRAAARGVRLRILLDPYELPNRAVAGELTRDGSGLIEVRWFAPTGVSAPTSVSARTSLVIVRHRGELWVNMGAADFTRPSLGDFNLEGALEMRLPARAAAGRALADHFAKEWASAAAYARFADESRGAYWRYRALQAGGLAAF